VDGGTARDLEPGRFPSGMRLFASVLHDGYAFGTIADDIRVPLA
jgi:hypothetical protein